MSTWQMGHGLIIAHQLHNIILFCQCLWELEFSTQKWPIFTNNSKILLNTSIPPKKISIITCPQFPPSSQHFQHIYLHIQPLVTHSLYVTKPVQHILFRSLKHIFLITSLLLWHFFLVNHLHSLYCPKAFDFHHNILTLHLCSRIPFTRLLHLSGSSILHTVVSLTLMWYFQEQLNCGLIG